MMLVVTRFILYGNILVNHFEMMIKIYI